MDNDIRKNVLESAFGLARALRRGPKPMEHDLPPAVERTLMVISENDGISSGELCQLLDMRPSSISELSDRMAEKGLVEKKTDEADKRVSRIFLTELGKAQAERIAEVRTEALNSFSGCFTDEEAEHFCELAGKLAAHLNENAGEGHCFGPHGPHGHGCGHHGPHGHGPHAFREGPGFPGPEGPCCGPHKEPHGHGHCLHHDPMHRF